MNVIVSEKRESGLFLSTYGFSQNAFETLMEVEKKIVKFVSLCRTSSRLKAGLWSPPSNLKEIIYEGVS